MLKQNLKLAARQATVTSNINLLSYPTAVQRVGPFTMLPDAARHGRCQPQGARGLPHAQGCSETRCTAAHRCSPVSGRAKHPVQPGPAAQVLCSTFMRSGPDQTPLTRPHMSQLRPAAQTATGASVPGLLKWWPQPKSSNTPRHWKQQVHVVL